MGESRETIILELCKSGALFYALKLVNSTGCNTLSNKPTIYSSLLQTCIKVVSLNHGLQIHAHVIKSGLDADRYVGNSLLALYFKLSPCFAETRRVFDGLVSKDVISWTSMITGYAREAKPIKSLELFRRMLDVGVKPNAFTLSAVVKSVSLVEQLSLGRCFHGVVIVHGFESSEVIASALIDMYGKNLDGLHDACHVFDELPAPDAVCWTCIISALTRNDRHEEALEIFCSKKREHGLLPDDCTFGILLTACGNLRRLEQGKEVHASLIKHELGKNVVVQSSLVDMYGKCGELEASQRVFDRMSMKNAVSWTALLGGYCQNGDFDSVIRLFREENGEDDLYGFGTVLRACAGLAAIRQGKEVHGAYLRRSGWRDIVTESALVVLYAKCGCVTHAHKLFVSMPMRNLITWNSMICGFAQNGRAEESISLFNEMIDEAVMKPDRISFLGVLFACSHTGMVDQGRRYFASMTKEHGITPACEHYNCMVDLLGRAGLVEEARSMIDSAEWSGHSSPWAVLLGACAGSADSIAAELIAKKTMQFKPDCHLSYLYLSNSYKATGRWDDAEQMRRLMEDKGLKKMPAKSWIEAKQALSINAVINP